MAIVPSGVSVPAQSKVLDNTTTTTVYGTVYRQVVTLADPETATNYMRVGGNGAYVDVRMLLPCHCLQVLPQAHYKPQVMLH